MVQTATAHDRSDEDDELYDPLTGLPGRLLQRAHLVHALRRAGRNGTKVAVLFLDVDDFHSLNERIGPELADQVLIVVAARIETSLRDTDMTARLDADEFVVVCEDIQEDQDLDLLERRILDSVSTPMHVGELVVEVRLSVGAVMGSGAERAGELLHAADLRMAEAKGSRRAS
jgi:diguanylate cyclase (GGDEF)-like protein